MGTAVYGGSPRHNAGRRISVGNTAIMSSGSSGSIIGAGISTHLGHSTPALHQHHHHIQHPQQQQQSLHQQMQLQPSYQQHQHHAQQRQQQQHNMLHHGGGGSAAYNRHHAQQPPQLQALSSTHHQSTATMFTVQSAAGSAALLMNHSSSTIIFPPPTSFISTAVPIASAAATTATTTGHLQHHQQQPQQLPHQQHLPPQQQQPYHPRQCKRKSAVELLAESKPFYVKSETVLDRHQHQLSFYAPNGRSSGNAAGNPQQQSPASCTMSPNRTMSQISSSHHLRHASNASSSGGGGGGVASLGAGYSASSNSRRSVSASSDLLQTKLRSLLNSASLDQGNGDDDDDDDAADGSAPDVTAATASTPATAYSTGGIKPHKAEKMYDHQAHHMHYASPKKLSQELSVLPDQNSDLAAFFPSAFLSPQSLPPHPAVTDDDIFSYGIDEPLLDDSDFHTISPPAEYAEDNNTTATTTTNNSSNATTPPHASAKHMKHNSSSGGYSSSRYSGYQRSFSHSPSAVGQFTVANTSPHDSIDLHASHNYPHHSHHSHQPQASTSISSNNAPSNSATAGNSSTSGFNINSHKSMPDLHAQISRHSPHSEALSCCSRGARSNKSGSSFNRDSGGSSGHYTHRSEPNSSGKQQPPLQLFSHGSGGSSSKYQQSQQHGQQLQQQQHQQQQQQQQQHNNAQKQPNSADFRRDSGSSTQHSGNSFYAYGAGGSGGAVPPTMRYDCIECRSSSRHAQQQQQQQQHQQLQHQHLHYQQHQQQYDDDHRNVPALDVANCVLDGVFPTPVVPEAFQDDYQQQQQQKQKMNQLHQHQQHLQQQQLQAQSNTAQMMMLMMMGNNKTTSASNAAVPPVRYARERDISNSSINNRQQQQQQRYATMAAYGEDVDCTDHRQSVHAKQHQHTQQPPLGGGNPNHGNHYGHKSGGQQQSTDPLELSPPLGTFKRQRCFRVKQRDRYSSPSDRNSRCCDEPGMSMAVATAATIAVAAPGTSASAADRQRPILRSKSDVSDRHWHRNAQQKLQQPQQQPHGGVGHQMKADGSAGTLLRSTYVSCAGLGGGSRTGSPESMSAVDDVIADGSDDELKRFFERLGLEDDVYEACIAPQPMRQRYRAADGGVGSGGGSSGTGLNAGGTMSASGQQQPQPLSDESTYSSPVFFSDASTVDSVKLQQNVIAAAEAMPASVLMQQQQQQQQQQQMYRPSEPPSIVERNARIIKWLCACRKSQLA